MSDPKKTTDRRVAALAPLARGLAVLPLWWVEGGRCACGSASCDNPGKHPLGKLGIKGYKSASKDPGQVERWWAAFPRANVGVATGRVSSVVVLDVDSRHGGGKNLEELEKKYGPLVETYRVRTGGYEKDKRGKRHYGEHRYYSYSDELVKLLKKLTRSPAHKPNGLDVLADGGYV